MDINSEILKYLRGDIFSNGLMFKIPSQKNIYSRNSMLAELSLGKKVLHIGCCDHEGLIINKKNTNTYHIKKKCKKIRRS